MLQYDTTHRRGTVVLLDGTELNGGVVFNDNEGVVTLHNGGESQSFNSRDIVKFEFYDSKSDRDKVFYVLEFNDTETGFKDVCFFEVLKEVPEFAVMAKIDRIKTEGRNALLTKRTSPLLLDRRNTMLTQTQTVYFFNGDGEFEPFLKIVDRELSGDLLDINNTKNKYINADLFQKYTGDHFETLVEYARQNKLSFKLKDHLITILDEYEKISKK